MTVSPPDDTADPLSAENEPTGARSTDEEAATVGGAETGAPETRTERPQREDLEPAQPQTVAETAEEFLKGLLEAMAIEAELTTSVDGDSAIIEVSGADLGLLIGRRGQTLDSLQELTRTAVQRRLKARVRLLLDIEGYRARRRATLAEYGREMAERAKARGTEIELEPMPAFERKIVHDAVAEVEGATSYSEGDGPDRKVIVRGT